MKHVVVLSLLLLFCLPASAVAELKIGVVNTVRLLQESPQAKESRKNLEREFSPREKKLREDEKRFKEKEEQLMRDSAVMSDAKRRKAERELLAMKRELQRSQDEFREDLNIRQNEEFGKLQKIISRIIDELAKEKGYDLILGENVIHAAEHIDITSEILERLGKEAGK
ncbi:MAG TPA: OmpH family outer membrane protein [Gammaproteobacteria bacterium]|nr:OmpH family outer membrane protein [Gammaproteobacteria bacterium]